MGFIDTAPDAFDVLIVDKAHWLTGKSGFYCNLGENQIKELIQAAKCAIFFIDEELPPHRWQLASSDD